ncbi:hypothetical protein [Peribacillus muralis]|uniref:hypothetical protein n=1 Tax=Peribacillus muralis TaxID=264697 RepID=UPI0036722D45
MKRRNFLHKFFIFIFAFIFGYSIKKEGGGMLFEQGNKRNIYTDEIKSLKEQFANKEKQLFYYVENELDFLRIVQSIKDSIRIKMTNKVKIILQAGSYTFDNTIIIPPYMRIGVNGVVVINFTGKGTLFHVKYENSKNQIDQISKGFGQNPLHNGNVFDGSEGALILKGGGKAASQIAMRFGDETLIESTHRKHLAWTHYNNFFIESFGTAFSFTQKENYIMTFNNITISSCGKIIKDEGNAINSGEEIRWNNCNFHNSNLFLELNSEINHIFNNCSIDYNLAGIRINNNKYATIRFINCWIEASNTPKKFPFIRSYNTTAKNVTVIMQSNYIYPKDKISDQIFKGKFKLVFKDNFLFINRHTSKNQNIAEGAFLCDDDVLVLSTCGTIFQEDPAIISRYQGLNANSNFETDTMGATKVTGFTRSNLKGEASFKIDNKHFFSGSKSLKIDTDSGKNNYINLLTEKVPIRNAERILGQARLFLPIVSKYDITSVITFYAEDKTTVIEKLTVVQNITTASTNMWVALLKGAYFDKPIPPKATHVEFKLLFSNLSGNIWVDDMIIGYY